MRDRPGVVLTRHFFSSLFDFGFLSDEGVDSFKRALLGGVAVAIGLGLLLLRVFMFKYASLAAGPHGAVDNAIAADHAFLMALPMWVVAAACGLSGQALFPGEIDYRILMAEPLSRRTVFSAKLAALLLFAGLFVVGTHAALFPLIAVTLLVGSQNGSFIASASAFAFASTMASLFAALAMVAVQGLLVIVAPRARLLTFSAAARSVVIGLLVLSLPLLLRLPAAAPAFASDAGWLRWAPPAWFVGLARWLTGGSHTTLATEAIVGTIIVLAVSVSSYAFLYRRFDRVTLHPGHSHAIRSSRRRAWMVVHSSVGPAIGRFVAITLRRSVVHQGMVVTLLAAAGGFVVNGLLAADGWQAAAGADAITAIPILVWVPMSFMFLASPAIRLSLSLPLELRANWIFRMTEDLASRGGAVAAGVRTVFALAVVVPTLLVAPLQWWLLGPRVIGLVGMEWLFGWLLAEWVMTEWRRIPFTCSYIPGKGFVPHVFVKAIGSYVVFTWFTTSLLQLSLTRPRTAPVLALLVAIPAVWLRRRRTRNARVLGLEFEDELPSDITPLRLNTD